eukprot:CAMPEP_0172732164 /NCGR_PEP_ID=MMETSP1074-20121228/103741_1 /TAXON_ID=2916 /ORGANISM="Ceratium fusus, Strain PA161109" /LENGTH=117 /DNA_ID=CAMNT_0013560399 /DNA_START=25 /DNA_END=378 /DNA_ORIENTATION=+
MNWQDGYGVNTAERCSPPNDSGRLTCCLPPASSTREASPVGGTAINGALPTSDAIEIPELPPPQLLPPPPPPLRRFRGLALGEAPLPLPRGASKISSAWYMGGSEKVGWYCLSSSSA